MTKYDDKGNKTEYNDYKTNGGLFMKFTYKYEGEASIITEREIEYYE
ncbi:MAG: hypothetical protein LBP63_09975 [Prevotellaceae bacterium]|nr:hypothetical protein [Prevotellaceae bacterium]